jgi:flagellum-specific ATP synthase/type III secretion protein N (ATPase)
VSTGAASELELHGLLRANDAWPRIVRESAGPRYRGWVSGLSGVIVEASGVPSAMSEIVRIDRGRLGPVLAEVIGFRGSTTLLMPHGELEGIAPRQRVTALGRSFSIAVADEMLGRALDGYGRPLDGQPIAHKNSERPVRSDAPPALLRRAIREPLQTGVRAIDALATVGRGQRIGIFAGSGVGKSTLLGQVTRGCDADVIIVALIGERGREVRGFLEDVLSPESRAKSVAVVATSDRAPMERFMAPFVALTCAEHWRDKGANVLLVMDSVTRFALAAREIGLAAGEPPTVRGFPPSFFATIPRIVERMGCSERGSITGLLTVLVDGDDPNEPVADTLRGLLDGHLMLSRDLAHRGHYPAIDVLASLSRLMPSIAGPRHRELAARMREDLAAWREGRDLVEIGAYRAGTNPRLDAALERMPEIDRFLRQDQSDRATIAETIARLERLYGAPVRA